MPPRAASGSDVEQHDDEVAAIMTTNSSRSPASFSPAASPSPASPSRTNCSTSPAATRTAACRASNCWPACRGRRRCCVCSARASTAPSWTLPAVSLRVISNMAVGFDNIDVKAATERGILVTNTPGVLTDATADLTWSLILSIARRVVEGDAMVRNEVPWRWAPFLLLGRRVAGATLGIVGMGRIGQAVARRALGWDMKVVYTRSSGPLAAGQVPRGRRLGVQGVARRPSPRKRLSSACTCRSLPTPTTSSAPASWRS